MTEDKAPRPEDAGWYDTERPQCGAHLAFEPQPRGSTFVCNRAEGHGGPHRASTPTWRFEWEG